MNRPEEAVHNVSSHFFTVKNDQSADLYLQLQDLSWRNFGVSWEVIWASLVTQMVKNPPAMQEIWVQSLGWEDSLEKGIANNSSIFAWRIPRTEEPGGLQSTGSRRVRHG